MTANTQADLQNDRKQFSYERKVVRTETISVHPGIQAMRQSPVSLKEMFSKFYNEFGYLEIPVVTEDGYAITHIEDLEYAIENDIEDIEIVVMRNATENDIVRFISFKECFRHGGSKRALYDTVKYLEHYLRNTPQGKEWAKEFDSNKTRAIISEITGASQTTIQNVSKMAKSGEDTLRRIDAKEITGRSILKKEEKPVETRKRYDAIHISNVPERTIQKLPEAHKLISLTAEFEDLGTLSISLKDGVAVAFLNDEPLDTMTHTATTDDGGAKGDRRPSQQYVFNPSDDRFSIQFILRDIAHIASVLTLNKAA